MKRIDIRRILGAMASTGGLTLAACSGANTTQGGFGNGMMGGGYGWMGGHGYGWMMVLVVVVLLLMAWVVARGKNRD